MRRFASLYPLLLATLVLPSQAVQAAAQAAAQTAVQTDRRSLTVDDAFAIAELDSPTLSPDGSRVAYTVETTDLEKDESETALYTVSADGGEPLRMSAPGYSVSNPRFSPDGRRLTVLAARDGDKSQVLSFDLRGGDAQPLTAVRQGVRGYVWSPDSSRLLLVIRDPKPGEEDAGEGGKEKDDDEEEKPEPWVIDRLQFKRDNIGYLDNRRSHLYVFELESETLTQITSGPYDDSDPAWSPDGKLVAFTSNRTPEPDSNDNTDIWIVSADTTDRGQTLRRVTTNPGTDSSPVFSPDGSLIAYTTQVEPDIIWYATRHLAVVETAGGEPRLLTTELDRWITTPRFSADGRSLLFLLEDSGEEQLASIEVTGKRLRRLVAGGVAVSELATAGDRAAFLLSRPHLPDEVFLYDTGAGLRQLTETNAELLAELELGEVEEVKFTSGDGTPVEAFITKPPGFDPRVGPYPTLLRIHGGPVSQYDHGFHFESQLFAAHGYLVVRPNPRGSSGYGQDFSLAIWAAWGEKDFEDVMAAVDYAIERGWADPKRLGVGGWSYGGILTNYVITKTDRFAGAVTGSSEVLYRANYGHDHYQHEWEKEFGLPWENAELWERLSPFNRIEVITTPTLILCGEKDWNVPVLNSEQLYQGLRRLGRTTQLVVYPDQHHSISRPTFRKDRYQRYLDWYDRYVKGQAGGAGEEPTGSGRD